jgi:hypothetical protein
LKDTAAIFERDRYLVVRRFLNKALLGRFYGYVRKAAEAGTIGMEDTLVPDTPFAYGDFLTDGLMVSLLPRIEELTGLKLFPTYSYCRLYKHRDVLKRHHDRPACEVSVSLCLGFEATKPWPFWIEGPGGPSSIILSPGDAVLYRGIECTHWREAFDGEHQAQLFLHYVEQNGPNAEWKLDKREALGDPRTVSPD